MGEIRRYREIKIQGGIKKKQGDRQTMAGREKGRWGAREGYGGREWEEKEE